MTDAGRNSERSTRAETLARPSIQSGPERQWIRLFHRLSENPTLEAAHECAASGCLVYTIFSTVDLDGRRVDFWRLLLPFGRDHKVEQLLASLQLGSTERRRDILGSFQNQSDVLLQGKIKSGFGAAKSEQTSSSDGPSASEYRRANRHKVWKTGQLSFAKRMMTCTVRDISSTGASLEAMNFTEVPMTSRW